MYICLKSCLKLQFLLWIWNQFYFSFILFCGTQLLWCQIALWKCTNVVYDSMTVSSIKIWLSRYKSWTFLVLNNDVHIQYMPLKAWVAFERGEMFFNSARYVMHAIFKNLSELLLNDLCKDDTHRAAEEAHFSVSHEQKVVTYFVTLYVQKIFT